MTTGMNVVRWLVRCVAVITFAATFSWWRKVQDDESLAAMIGAFGGYMVTEVWEWWAVKHVQRDLTPDRNLFR